MKDIDDIVREFQRHGRISQRSIKKLRDALLSDDPFEAITVATDCCILELTPEIARCLDSSDEMIRWNAAGSIYTRFRLPRNIDKGIKLASSDESTMVRAIALCGLGEVLPIISDKALRQKIASLLLSTFQNQELFPELRNAAYDGILAAMDVLPLDRPPAGKLLNIETDVDHRTVEDFKNLYL
jgi:hypothetical protein